MILYRLGNQLFLSSLINEKREITQVYSSNEGTLGRFRVLTKSDGEAMVIYLIILQPGIIMINAGSYDKVKEGEWLSLNTGRDDLPIDCMISPGSYGSLSIFSASISFLYSDLSFSAICYKYGKLKLYKYARTQEVENIITPIRSLGNRNYNRGYKYDIESMTIVDDDSKIYDIAIIWNKYGHNLRSIAISPKLPPHEGKIIGGNGVDFLLYSDGDLVFKDIILKDVIKIFCTGVLRSNGLLIDFFQEYNEEYFLADGVTNFFCDYLAINDGFYMIKNDQLIYRPAPYIRDDEDNEVIITSGAKKVKFPTNSYHDVMLNSNRSSTKSAAKRDY